MADAHPETAATDVYAVYGVEPEILAYAMARYSRSSLSMRESLAELSTEKAERFLNTFYFQYGHRSIADLAHIAFAIERLSLVAAIELEDEQRWDGQERSTRYQDFSRPDYYVPEFADARATDKYREAIDSLFAEYRFFSDAMFERLTSRTPRPEEMKPDQYERTLRARAFDIARYLLPLATNTSVGQIVNARTLETQIARLLTSRFAEVCALAAKLKGAAKNPAYSLAPGAEVRPAPTLVKYAEANAYLAQTRDQLAHAAAHVMNAAPVDDAPAVDLLDDEPLEVELATTLLYEHCWYPYRQIRTRVAAMSDRERQAIIDLGVKYRGSHDELLRAYCGGQKFRFDILMDVGGFRDLHRHRRCVQIHQGFVFAHGFETPDDIAQSPHGERYAAALRRVAEVAHELANDLQRANREWRDALYLMPLAYRKRTLFKMDFAEAVYISELRTGPAGHFSYRRVAWEMYRAVAARHPQLASLFRVHDPGQPVDLLQR